jgi:HSP20 family protein
MSSLAKNNVQKEAASAARTANRYVSPEVNIYEKDDAYIVVADLPGVTRQGLEVTLEGNELAVVGHHHREFPEEGVLHRESNPVDFRRSFELDPSIDAARIVARMEQGVLTLEMPKTEAVKPRKIDIS